MDNPIGTLLKVSLENIKDMIDVNTIVGDVMNISDTIKIIPISKVKCGFMAGGSEIKADLKKEGETYPFGGGTGGTVSITPVAFIVCNNDNVKILNLEHEAHLFEKVVDYIPVIKEKIADLFKDEAKEVEV